MVLRKPKHVQLAREILALEHQDQLAVIGELLATKVYWVAHLGPGGTLCIHDFQSYPEAREFSKQHPDHHIFSGNLMK